MQQKDYFKCSNENKTLHLHDISSIQYDIMNIKMKELEESLPKESCSFCSHLSLEGPNQDLQVSEQASSLNTNKKAWLDFSRQAFLMPYQILFH